MSINDGSLQLYLKFDAIEDKNVIDVSGKKINGIITGNPEIIDDELLGKCLQLDGNLDRIDLPNTAIPIGQEITVSFWANGGDGLPAKKSSIINDKNNGPARILNIHLPWRDSKVHFDCGNDGSGYDRISKTVSPSDFKEKWSYWGFTKNANTGEMKIYLNGQLWHIGKGKNKQIPQINNDVQLGSHNSTETYEGKLAHFRIYNRALSQQEIKRDMGLSIVPGLAEELNELRSLKATWEKVKQGIGDLNSADRQDIPEDIKNILGILGRADITRQILLLSATADRDRDRANEAQNEALQFAKKAEESAKQASSLFPDSLEAQKGKDAANEANNAAIQAKTEFERAEEAARSIKDLINKIVTPNNETPEVIGEPSLEQLIEEDVGVKPVSEEPVSPEKNQYLDRERGDVEQQAKEYADTAESAKEEAYRQRDLAKEKAEEAAQQAKRAGEYYDNWETIGDIFGFSESITDGNTPDDTDAQKPDDFEDTLSDRDNWQVIGNLFGLPVKGGNSEATKKQS